MKHAPVLRLTPLLEIKEGKNLNVLLLMQRDALQEAIEDAQARGLQTTNPQALFTQAEGSLPAGSALSELYARRVAQIAERPMSDLEAVSRSLSISATHLESVAMHSLALKNRPTAEIAMAEHSIAERYVELIKAAQNMEDMGVIPVSHREQLERLSARPTGPLSAFYDKAMTLLNAEQKMPMREARYA